MTNVKPKQNRTCAYVRQRITQKS